MAVETMTGVVEECVTGDAVDELQLAPDDLDVVASVAEERPDEMRCEGSYCPSEYCGSGYQSDAK